MEISEDLRRYLTDEPRVAKIASIRRTGTPWIQPVWFALDGDVPILVISGSTVLGRTVRRDPNVALCVDDTNPYGFATLEGRLEIRKDAAAASRWTRRMVHHYLPGTADVEAYVDELLSDAPIVCRMDVTRTFFRPVLD